MLHPFGPPLTQLKLFVLSYSGASVHKAYAGESERILREAFSKAASEAATGRPAIIFIDEIDTMCPPRDSRYLIEMPIAIKFRCG